MAEYQVSVILKCYYPPGVRAVKHDDEHLNTRKFVLTPRSMVLPIGRASARHHQRGTPQDGNALFNSPVVSRQHAEFFIKREVEGLFIRDCGSMHGTSVNGTQLPRHGDKRVRNHDNITIGSNVLHGDREYQARQFSVSIKIEPYKSDDRQIMKDRLVKIADAEQKNREPSVCEIQDPAKKPNYVPLGQSAPITYRIYDDDSDFDEEDQEERRSHKAVNVQGEDPLHEKVEATDKQQPGSSPTNPLNIDEEVTMPLKRSNHNSKPIKRTSITINELYNGTDDDESDEEDIADALPVVATRPWRTVTAFEAGGSNVSSADSREDEADRDENHAAESADEQLDGNIFTPSSSPESSSMTSPARVEAKHHTVEEEDEASEVESDSEDEDYESSDHEDDSDSYQWSVDGDGVVSAVDEQAVPEKGVLHNMGDQTPASVNDCCKVGTQAHVEKTVEKDLCNTNTITLAEPSCLEESHPLGWNNTTAEQAKHIVNHPGYISSMAKTTIAKSNAEIDLCKRTTENLAPRLQYELPQPASRDLFFFDAANPEANSMGRNIAVNENIERWTSGAPWVHDDLYSREKEPWMAPPRYPYYSSPFASQNEYHSWYPVHGLSQTACPNLPSKAGSLFAQPYTIPKPRQWEDPIKAAVLGALPNSTAIDCSMRSTTIMPTHKIDKSEMSATSSNEKHSQSRPYQASSRSKLAISTIVEPVLDNSNAPRQSTLKRKADLISTVDVIDDNTATKTELCTVEAAIAKPSAVHGGTVADSDIAGVRKVTAPSDATMPTEILRISMQEPPRKKARHFTSSARPFLLGALVGGVGVIGALISLPESFF